MAKIKMKTSVTVAETFHDFLTGKKAAGVSEKTLLTYGQHFSAVSKHLSPDTPMDTLDKSVLDAMISSMRDADITRDFDNYSPLAQLRGAENSRIKMER